MTALKALAASIAGLLLIPVLVLGAFAGGLGDTSGQNMELPPKNLGELEAAVLGHPAIRLTAAARGDVQAGVIDPRVLQLLLLLAESYELGPVGPLISGHSYYVKGTTRVSNHVYGRAVDILGVDGAPVSPSNPAARELMKEILALPEWMQPDELGGPWAFTNGRLRSFVKDHSDHVHAGWRTKAGTEGR